jgi:hypothetical protein
MTITAAIRRMLENGLTVEQALSAAEAFEQEVAQPVNKRQERNRRYYENRKERLNSDDKASSKTFKTVSDVKTPLPPPEGSSPKPLSPNPLLSIPPSPPKGGSSPAEKREFETEFWPAYPHKVGKQDAERAFAKARRQTPLSALLAGLQAYIDTKPSDRPWLNPATWLNGARWTDRPALVTAKGQAPPGFRTSDGILAALKRKLDDDDDSPDSDQPRNHEDVDNPLFRLAAQRHDRE